MRRQVVGLLGIASALAALWWGWSNPGITIRPAPLPKGGETLPLAALNRVFAVLDSATNEATRERARRVLPESLGALRGPLDQALTRDVLADDALRKTLGAYAHAWHAPDTLGALELLWARRLRQQALSMAEVVRELAALPVPSFAQYPASVAVGVRVAPMLVPGAPSYRFRTLLRTAAAEGPNFAGHYVIATWGCGTQCRSYAVVDLRTGRVFEDARLDFSCHEPDFRRDSRLVVQRAMSGPAVPCASTTTYWEWRDTGFIALR